jgi:hypothetical protein
VDGRDGACVRVELGVFLVEGVGALGEGEWDGHCVSLLDSMNWWRLELNWSKLEVGICSAGKGSKARLET